MKYKIFLLNILIVFICTSFSLFSIYVDDLLGLHRFHSMYLLLIGCLFVIGGLLFRICASLLFYKNNVAILILRAQGILIIEGLYAFTRNPLYIGIILIFTGIVLIVGTYSGLFMVLFAFFITDYWVRNGEEKYMEKEFGETYLEYKKRTLRWI